MKRPLFLALLMVLTFAFLAQVIAVAQVGPPTAPPDDPNSSSNQGTSNSSTDEQTYSSPSSAGLQDMSILTPFGACWVEVCYHGPNGELICEWVCICCGTLLINDGP